MNLPRLRALSVFLAALLLITDCSFAETLARQWTTEFPKNVSWYVRTSAGILIVGSGKTLTALDAADGRTLWESHIEFTRLGHAGINNFDPRGKNLLEIPGTGILLVNRVNLPNGTEDRLVALNLMTGEQLWDKPQVDDLMRVVMLQDTRDVLVVTRQLNRKANAMELGAMVASAPVVGIGVTGALYTYPFKIRLERLDPMTGKSVWNSEYDCTFHFDSHNIVALENHLFIFYGNGTLASFDLKDGKFLWDCGVKRNVGTSFAVPLLSAHGRVIYGMHHKVYAADPSTGLADWSIDDIGKISGLSLCDGLVIVSGSKKVAAVDAATGIERWSEKPHGDVSNTLWDKQSDVIYYADSRGLHGLERATGKPVYLSKSRSVYEPYMIRRESPETMVILGVDGISAYNFKKDAELYTTKKLVTFYRGYTFQNQWPLPLVGEDLTLPQEHKPENVFSGGVAEGTLLAGDALERTRASFSDEGTSPDVFKTANELGRERIWWIDPETNLFGTLVYGAAGSQHEVSRPLGMVFAADGKYIWSSKILKN